MEEPMADAPLTLMTVHAHPDDEASTTGGILAKYAAEGVRTVLVTCTNGECGDGPNGAKPGDPDHDGAAVVALRRAELKESARILGVSHLELLGYRDSGMAGWETNHAPRAFATIPVDEARAPLHELRARPLGNPDEALLPNRAAIPPRRLSGTLDRSRRRSPRRRRDALRSARRGHRRVD